MRSELTGAVTGRRTITQTLVALRQLRSWRRQLTGPAITGNKKAPDNAGAFELLELSRDQYLATTGPPQLKR